MFDFGTSPNLLSQHFTSTFVGDEVLTPNEKQAASRFSDKRLKDFSTGRHCARKALGNLGCENAEILIGDDKQPIWPPGYVGSISHSGKLAGAVVSHASKIKSVGLDIETIGKITPEMWELLYTDKEKELLSSFIGEKLAHYTTLLFSFKESFYKLQFPLTHTYLNFTDVEIRNCGNKFELAVINGLYNKEPFFKPVQLYHIKQKNQVITLCYLA